MPGSVMQCTMVRILPLLWAPLALGFMGSTAGWIPALGGRPCVLPRSPGIVRLAARISMPAFAWQKPGKSRLPGSQQSSADAWQGVFGVSRHALSVVRSEFLI